MKLTVEKRKLGKTRAMRRNGGVPAILYGQGHADTPLTLKLDELQALLRNMKAGLLATTLFELTVDGKTHKAIVKEVQYHPATYAIQHVDFVLVTENRPVTINVPLQVIGAADCAGIKLGGFLRQVVRTMQVTCLPKHIPQEFTIDVREMNVGDSKTLADVQMPANVRPLAKLDSVAIVVGKKAGAA